MKFKIVHMALAAALVLSGCATGVSFQSTGTESATRVSGLLFKPKGEGVHPAIVVLHTCGGLLPHVTQDWPDYLTGLGYVVLSVDSYSPRGASRCTDLSQYWYKQADDAYGALNYLIDLPFVDGDRVGVMGFSAGGSAINGPMFSTIPNKGDPEFKAAIAIYGRCYYSIFSLYTEKKVPLMEIVAENDKGNAPLCIEIGKSLPIEVRILEGAYHAFDNSAASGRSDAHGNIMQYSARAVTESERHVKSFLAKHLGK